MGKQGAVLPVSAEALRSLSELKVAPALAGGIMGTHDEETRKYFENTKVKCVLFPREAMHAQESMMKKSTADRIFTHHQKTVGASDAP